MTVALKAWVGYSAPLNGGVAEWLKAHAWKACLLKGNAGSNPAPSAIALPALLDKSSRNLWLKKISKKSVWPSNGLMDCSSVLLQNNYHLYFFSQIFHD